MRNYAYGSTPNLFGDIKSFFRQGSILSILILINVIVWILVQSITVIGFLNNVPGNEVLEVLKHAFAIPAYTPLLTSRPWTMFTYMFLHFDVWHILFNMLWLYWFGRIFLEFLSSRLLLWVYLLGGLCGGLLYVLSFNLLPVFAPVMKDSFALGASASVMAIVAAISFFVPNYSIQLVLFGRLKIIYLAAVLFVFDFFMIPSGNAGGHIAHIGGAIMGTLFISIYKLRTSVLPYRQIGQTFENIFNFFRKKDQHTKNQQPFNGFRRPVSDEDFNLNKKSNQEKVDKILEKISKGGYDCLTKDEKEFLFKSSKKN